MKALESEDTLGQFLAAFEDGTLPKEEWTHQAHIVMAACVLHSYPLEEATSRIREGIKAYNVASGGQNTETSGYHESITIFWIQMITDDLNPSLSRLDQARAMSERFGEQSSLFKKYWSYDIAKSVEARRSWIEPDRRDIA